MFPSLDPLHAGLDRFVAEFSRANLGNVAGKLGLAECRDGDLDLMQDLHGLMQTAEIDMTIFFRRLAGIDVSAETPALDPLVEAFYDPEKMLAAGTVLRDWLSRYAARARRDSLDPAERRRRMHAASPRYVLRNYLAQQAIDRAEQGDYGGIAELLNVLRRPYDDQDGADAFDARRPDWARHRAGCSMLSCSS